MARITISVSRVLVFDSSKEGLNLPSLSKTEVQQTSSIPLTLWPSPKIRFGPHEG